MFKREVTFPISFLAPFPLMGEGWDEAENQDSDPSLMLLILSLMKFQASPSPYSSPTRGEE